MKQYVYLLAIVLMGCQSTAPKTSPEKEVVTTPPKEPMMCTMQYDPVCATIELNGKTMERTFGNSCTMVNAEGKVVSSYQGECGKPAAL